MSLMSSHVVSKWVVASYDCEQNICKGGVERKARHMMGEAYERERPQFSPVLYETRQHCPFLKLSQMYLGVSPDFQFHHRWVHIYHWWPQTYREEETCMKCASHLKRIENSLWLCFSWCTQSSFATWSLLVCQKPNLCRKSEIIHSNMYKNSNLSFKLPSAVRNKVFKHDHMFLAWKTWLS